MAEDFVELGIEGIDKLVDKHFHKVPDRYVDPHTYHPRCRRRGRRGSRNDESGESDIEPENVYDMRSEEPYQRERRNRSPTERGYGYGYRPPSQQTRDPYSQDDWTRRRPGGLVRRSSSQPGNFRGDERETGVARRRRSLSEERRPNDAKGGSRGGFLEKPASKTDAVSLTLLGLAAAGLAATSVMTVMKHRERTKELKELEEKKRGGRRNGRGDRGENLNAGHRERSTGRCRDQPVEGRRTKGGGGGGGGRR